ncbi:N-acetyltransferase [Citrobacter freundii]|uniref:N-acetyltransferase n=1 Tax=Citrobacter freundii TaxID=546 RepID=UPI0023B17708|nr:N-acetyltransferase [Citrobacter freundii]
MTLQIRDATPADAMLLNALGYRIYRAHFEQKVMELRLYVHGDNGLAIRAYERCGFTESPYTIMKVDL